MLTKKVRSGTVELRPTLEPGTPYRIETIFGDVFEYVLRDVSPQLPAEVAAREAQLLRGKPCSTPPFFRITHMRHRSPPC